MTIKITTPNGGSDSLDFGCAQTPVVATVTGTEVSSGEGKLELKTTTGGTSATKATVLANGNVGIGAASPDQKLHVAHAGRLGLRVEATTTDIAEVLLKNTTETWGIKNEGGNLVIADESTGIMATVLKDSGKVGIGIAAPTGKFAVSDGTTTGEINPTGGICWMGTRSNHPVAIQVNASEKMRIDSSGTVTLGTPLPVASGGTGVTGGSGWVKLATTGDITSGTSFTIDNCFSTTYHKYRFVYDVTNGGASSGSNHVAFRLRTGGASGADLTSTYHYRATRGYSGHSTSEIAHHDRNYVNDNYNRLDKGQHGVIDIFRSAVHNAPVYFDYESIGTHPNNDESFPTKIQGANHTNNTTITGLKLYLYSGETSNAWTGRMTVYGAIR